MAAAAAGELNRRGPIAVIPDKDNPGTVNSPRLTAMFTGRAGDQSAQR